MIRYKEIAFIAYPVTDMTRARKFYEGILDLKPNAPLESETPQWIEYDIGAGTLGIGSYPGWDPSPQGQCVGLEVDERIECRGAGRTDDRMGATDDRR